MFDKKNILNLLVYIINKVETKDFHNISKIFYWADQEHMVKYGRDISKNTFIAMPYGPVPGSVKGLIDSVRCGYADDEVISYFDVVGKHSLKALKNADLDYISKSEIECIDNAIQKSDRLTFDQRTAASHGEAYEKGKKNSYLQIDPIDIAIEGGANEELVKYLQIHM